MSKDTGAPTDDPSSGASQGPSIEEAIRLLSPTQLNYAVMRTMAKSNKEAAEKVGINPNTVSNWSRPVRDAIETVGLRYRLDAATAARLVLEGAALQAALIKIQALDDIEERQKASTEILDRVLGKARQTVEHKGENLAPKTYVGWSPDEWGDQPSGEG